MPPRPEPLKKKSPKPKMAGRLESSLAGENIGAYSRRLTGVAAQISSSHATNHDSGIALHEWGYLPKCKEWAFQSVSSPFWRLYYNSQRGHSIKAGDTILHLGPEHLVLVPPHCVFDCQGFSPVPHFWIHFSSSKRLLQNHPKPISLPPRDAELSIIRVLTDLRRGNNHSEATEKEQLLGLALIHAVMSRDEFATESTLPLPLVKTLEFIERNFTSELNGNDLAKIAGLSASGLYRIFQSHLHTSPGNYILALKIQKAIRLLKETDESIELIADETGFHDRFHLTKIFKKMTGKTPPQFRKEHPLLHPKTHHPAQNLPRALG